MGAYPDSPWHFRESRYRRDRPCQGEKRQPDLRRPPPTEWLRDSFAWEDSSAPCCINILSPEMIQIPKESVLFVFLGVLFLSHSSKVLDSQKFVNAHSKLPASTFRAIRDRRR